MKGGGGVRVTPKQRWKGGGVILNEGGAEGAAPKQRMSHTT